MSSTSSTSAPSSVSANSESGAAQQAPTTTVHGELAEFIVPSSSSIAVRTDQAPPPPLDPGSIDSVLLREHKIYSLTVNGTEIVNANLFGALDPFQLLFQQAIVWNAVKPYAYFRGDLRLRVVVTPPGSCMGAMVLSAICEGGLNTTPSSTVNTDLADDMAVDSLFTSFNDAFRVINFEQATSVEMELPFQYYDNYMPVTQSALYMWRLQLQSLVAIQSTISTSAAATINIYASFKPGYTLGMAKYQSKKNVSKLDGFKKGNASAHPGFNESKFSDIASSVSSIASKVAGTIPILAPFATPLAAGAAIASTVASFFGYTRESTYVPPDPVVQRLFASLPLTDGVDSGEKLVMLSGSALSIDSAVGGGEHDDPMCFEAIRQRWGCISYFDLTTSTTAGQVLFNLPVTPSYGGVNLGSFFLTPGGYFGLPFQYWRGGMEYMIYIPSSSNMRGMLQVCYNPSVRGTAGPFTIPDPTGQVHSVALDLSGTQQHIIQVPYSSAESAKANAPMCDGKYVNRIPGNCNGSLDFFISTPWVAPRVGVISTRVFILARPMQDMTFAQPRTCFANLAGLQPFTGCIKYQSGPVDDSVLALSSTILNTPLDASMNLAQSCFTETAPSARALCQKFAMVYKDGSTGALFTSFPLYFFPTWATTGLNFIGKSNTTDVNQKIPWTWAAHYAMLYVGVRGSMRYKLIREPSGLLVPTNTIVHARMARQAIDDIFSWNEYSFGVHEVVQRIGAQDAAEVAIPFSSPRLYANPRAFTGSLQTGITPFMKEQPWNVGVGFSVTALPDSNIIQEWWYAAGDDFSGTRFRRVPRLLAGLLLPAT